MSLFKGYKIDYNQAEADTKLAKTNERIKEVKEECYKAVLKQLDNDLQRIKRIYPNCVAEEITASSEFEELDKDFIFSYSQTKNFEGYVINKYLVRNEVNYQKDCYEDNYHEKLEWSYALSETASASFVIFKSEEKRKNYIDIGKYIKIKNFSEKEFVENDKVLKCESEDILKRDKDNIDKTKKMYESNKGKNIFLNSASSIIRLSSMFFYIMACVSLFLICYGGNRNKFFMWFTEIPYYSYLIVWGVNLICVLLCINLFRQAYGKVDGSAVVTFLVSTGIISGLMIFILLKYDYFTGNDADAIKWLKLLTYISAFLNFISLANAFPPIRLSSDPNPEKALEVRELQYRNALEYMNDPVNKKCYALLTERKEYILSHTVLKSEKEKIEMAEKLREEQNKQDEVNEILKKFEG